MKGLNNLTGSCQIEGLKGIIKFQNGDEVKQGSLLPDNTRNICPNKLQHEEKSTENKKILMLLSKKNLTHGLNMERGTRSEIDKFK